MSDNPFGAKLRKVAPPPAGGADSPAAAAAPPKETPSQSPLSPGVSKAAPSAANPSFREPRSPTADPGSPAPGLKTRNSMADTAANAERRSSAAPNSPLFQAGARASVPATAASKDDDAAASAKDDTDSKAGGAALERVGSQISQRSKAGSAAQASGLGSRQGSQVAGSVRGSQAGGGDDRASLVSGAAIPRVASQAGSVHSAAPSVGDIMRENDKLKAQIESLQRLYASKDNEAKIHRFQEDLDKRAHRIKELETHLKEAQEEAKKWKTEASKKEKKKKGHHGKEEVHHHDSEVAEKNTRIHELEQSLAKAQREIAQLHASLDAAGTAAPAADPANVASRATSHSDGPSPALTRPIPPAATATASASRNGPTSADLRPYQEEISKLRQEMIEKDMAMRVLDGKLTQAQEAILGSAGVGWENHVKLHQTKGMLTKIIQASPQRSGRLGSASPDAFAASPSNSPPPLSAGGARARPELSPAPLRADPTKVTFKTEADAHGVLRLWKVQGDSQSLVTCVSYTNGVVCDQVGAVLALCDSGDGRGEMSRLASLCDMCGVPHTLPSEPVVVVAGHTVSMSPTANNSRYKSPTRRGY